MNNLSAESNAKRLKYENPHTAGSSGDYSRSRARDRSRDKVERTRSHISRESSPRPDKKRRSYSPNPKDRRSYAVEKASSQFTKRKHQETQNEIANSILGVSSSNSSSKSNSRKIPRYSPRNVAFACRALGKTQNIRFVDNTLMRQILEEVLSQKPNAQDIAMIIDGLGKFAENAKNSITQESMSALCELAQNLHRNKHNGQDLCNTIVGLCKFLEQKLIQNSDLALVPICKLVQLLVSSDYEAKHVYFVIHRLSKVVEADYKLYDEGNTLKALCILMQGLPKSKLDAQIISNTIHGLSKFVAAGYKLYQPEETLSAIFESFERLPSTLSSNSFRDQNISTALLGLSKFMDDTTKVPNKVFETIFALLSILSPETSNDLTICTTIFALGKLAEHKIQLQNPEETMRILCTLFNSLKAKNVGGQHITMASIGLSRFVERGYRLYDEKNTMNTLASFVESLPDKDAKGQGSGNTLLALGKFVEHKIALENPKQTMRAVCFLVRATNPYTVEARSISQILSALNKLVEQGYSLDRQAETMKVICQLVCQLPKQPYNLHAITMSLHGLSRMLVGDLELDKPDEVMKAVSTLILSLPIADTSQLDTSLLVYAMGKFLERGYHLPNGDRVLNMLCELTKNIPNANVDDVHISNILLGLSKFAERGFVFQNPNELMVKLCRLVKLQTTNRYCSQSLSVTIFAMGKFLDRGFVFHDTDQTMDALCKMFIDMQRLNPDSIQIATSIQGIGKCVEHKLILSFPEAVMATIDKLIEVFPLLNPTSRHINMVVHALGKLVKAGYHFPDVEETMAAICSLVPRIKMDGLDVEACATTSLVATGLSRFVEEGHILDRPEATMKHFCLIVQEMTELFSANSKTHVFTPIQPPRPQDIAHLAVALTRFVNAGQKIYQPEKTLPCLFFMMKAISFEKPNVRDIALMAIALSGFASYGYVKYIPRHVVVHLCTLITVLPNMVEIAKDISSTIYALGTLVQEGFVEEIGQETMAAVSKLALRLGQTDPDLKNMALATLGLTKLLEQRLVVDKSDEIMAVICTYIEENFKNSVSPFDFSLFIAGLARAVKYDIKLYNPDMVLTSICTQIRTFDHTKVDATGVSSLIFSIGTLVRYGYELDLPKETMAAVCGLIKTLIQKKPNITSIATALFGLGWLVKGGHALSDNQTSGCVDVLFKSLDGERITGSELSMILKALNLLTEHQVDRPRFVHDRIFSLRDSIGKNYHDNNGVFDLLSLLGDLEYDNTDDLANRLISKLVCKKFHKKSNFASPKVIAAGILGYAKLLTKIPSKHAISALLSIIKRLESAKASVNVYLPLLQAYAIFKEKNVNVIVEAIDIDLVKKRFLASDPTEEEMKLAGLTEQELSTLQKKPSLSQLSTEPLVFAGFCQKTNEVVKLAPMQKPTTYDLTTEKGQRDLTAHLQKDNIKFIPENVPILVCPIFAIQNELGALAQRKLNPSENLGRYIGDVVEGESAISGSMYAFDISTNDEGVERFIDARHTRNFAAFLNHSTLSNVAITANDETINFQVSQEEVLPNQQCFINYGEEFFPMLGFQPRYLDPLDSWESFDQLVLQNKEAYLPTVSFVSAEIQAVFRLPSQKMLLSKLAHAILSENEHESLRLIKSQSEHEVELWSYCVDDSNTIMMPDSQQRITALMLASYLGQTRVVNALLQKAKTSARLLQTGETAAFFALKGKSANRSELFKMFFNHGIYINLTNRENVSYLNLAVEENVSDVVELLLSPKCTLDKKEFLELFANSQIDSLYNAICSGKLEGVKALLKKTTQSWLCPKIVEKELLVLKALDENPHFDKAIEALVESGNIHKNYEVVTAMCERFGTKARWLITKALEAKQWPAKERKALEKLYTKLHHNSQ